MDNLYDSSPVDQVQVPIPGSTQEPLSSNRILKITNPDEMEPFPNSNAFQSNCSDSNPSSSNKDFEPQTDSSALDMNNICANGSTSEAEIRYTTRSEYCHNCRTLGIFCTVGHEGSKCDQCVSLGMNCDLSISDEERETTHKLTRHSDHQADGAICEGNEDGSEDEHTYERDLDDCSRCGRSYRASLDDFGTWQVLDPEMRILARHTVQYLIDSGLELKPGGERALFDYFATGQIPDRSLASSSMYCRPCRVQSANAWEARCLRGRDEQEVAERQGTDTSQVSKAAKNCAGCFDRLVDQNSTDKFCETCEVVVRRCMVNEEEIGGDYYESRRTSDKIEESKVLRVVNMPDTSGNEATGKTSSEQLRDAESSDSDSTDHDYQDCNPQPLETQGDELANINQGSKANPVPQPTTPNASGAEFQSCVSCLQNDRHCEPCISSATNERFCDQDIPSCTACEMQGKKCSYRYLVNTRRTEPVRYFEVPRTCFWCSQRNVRIGISGLCSTCEVVREKSIESVSEDTASASKVQQSNPAPYRSLKPHNIQYDGVRQQAFSKPSQENSEPKRETAANRTSTLKGHTALPVGQPSEASPLPGFTTPCLGCSDTVISCAIHPPISSSSRHPSIRDTSLSASTKHYIPLPIPLSIRSNPTPNSTPTNSEASGPAKEDTTPCLACFDVDTKCAQHLTTADDRSVIKVAQACGSCRFALRECDGKKPRCGQCDRRRLECLFIRGDLANIEVEDGKSGEKKGSEAVPRATSPTQEDETPQDHPSPPLACGGCRIADIQCDGARPGCSSCKGKGLECLYITGKPSSHDEATTSQHRHVDTQSSKRMTHNTRLANSPLLTPTVVAADEDIVTEINVNMRESQIVDSSLSTSAGENVAQAADSEGNGDEEVDEEGKQSENSDSEDWDVVSATEDYDIVNLGRESEDGMSSVL
ncbi:hypothetical protein VTL71DRAFT_2994 [Oculimacula yallundae]|uniref:Zn(2)-C6 fungal-type domain-containing protein n=1 Tax=Oculimacula yallundae TaxID=86028 RepID=A0ABR4C5V2_9HELO